MIASTVAIQSKQGGQENLGVPASGHNDEKMRPGILEKYQEIDGQLYMQVALFPLFSFRNKSNRQDLPSSQHSQSSSCEPCMKESEEFLITSHLLNAKTLYFEFYHKQQKKIMIRLAIANENLSDLAKNLFRDVSGLFQQLQNNEMMIYLSPSGELVARVKAADQVETIHSQYRPRNTHKDIQQNHYQSKRAAALQAIREKQMRQAEEVRMLLVVQQNQRNSGKEALKNIQMLIQKSRCLPETSPEVQGVMQLWKRRLSSALTGNSIEQLHLALIICEKYWLRHDLLAQDELMNIMRQRMGRLIDSGQWMLE